MSEVTTRQFNTTTVSQLPKAEAPAQRSSATSQLNNDTTSHVIVLRTLGGVPMEVFGLAPNATSDAFEAGSELYFRNSEGSGGATVVTWSGFDNITAYFNGQRTASEGMNQVSQF